MNNPDPAALATVPLFEGLSSGERARVAEWLEIEDVDPGSRPTVTHRPGYAFYILEQGRAHAELDGQVLEVLEPGAVFGEMAFFAPDGRRSADVVADGPIRVLSMFGTRFREMQMQMPAVADRLEQICAERAARVWAAQEHS